MKKSLSRLKRLKQYKIIRLVESFVPTHFSASPDGAYNIGGIINQVRFIKKAIRAKGQKL